MVYMEQGARECCTWSRERGSGVHEARGWCTWSRERGNGVHGTGRDWMVYMEQAKLSQ